MKLRANINSLEKEQKLMSSLLKTEFIQDLKNMWMKTKGKWLKKSQKNAFAAKL